MPVPSRISALSPLKKRLLATGCGAASTLAMPPLLLWPLLFITLPLLVFLLDDGLQNQQRAASKPLFSKCINAAITGWCFGTGFFIFSLYWIGASFLVEADKFAILMPLAVILLPAALALFYALGFALAAPFWSAGPERVLTLAIVCYLADIARSTLFTGLPWSLLGHSLTSNDIIMQSMSLYGLYGLTPVAVLIFASPAALWVGDATRQAQRNKSALALIATSAAALVGLYGFGTWRLTSLGPTDYVPNLTLFLVHPNVPQKEKVTPELRPKAFERALELTATIKSESDAAPDGSPMQRLIIWPETAIPFALNRAELFKDHLLTVLKKGDQLITGGFWLEQKPEPLPKGAPPYKVFNSLFVFDDKASITARYDKHHLVPFGEYLPFPSLLSAIGLEALVRMRGGFTSGNPPVPLVVQEAPPFLPFICYEAIFPITDQQTQNQAKWILNISNDAWFGRTAGPYQHQHYIKLRALETGLPVIRVVNNGMTAVFDGLGRKIHQTELGAKGVLKSRLPKAVKPFHSKLPAPLTFLLHLAIIFLTISTMKNFDKSS